MAPLETTRTLAAPLNCQDRLIDNGGGVIQCSVRPRPRPHPHCLCLSPLRANIRKLAKILIGFRPNAESKKYAKFYFVVFSSLFIFFLRVQQSYLCDMPDAAISLPQMSNILSNWCVNNLHLKQRMFKYLFQLQTQPTQHPHQDLPAHEDYIILNSNLSRGNFWKQELEMRVKWVKRIPLPAALLARIV